MQTVCFRASALNCRGIVGTGTRVHSRRPPGDGKRVDFLPYGSATTNCVFSGKTLWVADVGLTTLGTEATSEERIWRMSIPGGGVLTYRGHMIRRPRHYSRCAQGRAKGCGGESPAGSLARPTAERV